jgi:hypothetical protein
MAIFRYTKTVEMAPKEGQKFATTYYKQRPEEAVKTKQFIALVGTEIISACERNPELQEFCQQPLRGFPRTNNKPNYSIEDVICDMIGQMENGKDLPSGMMGRWGRLFNDTEYDIELLQEHTPTKISPRLFNDLFSNTAPVDDSLDSYGGAQ